mgnify:CR=1 FL=1
MLLADYQAYIDCQQAVGEAYSNTDHWTRMSILNSIRMGQFSSDRSIREYCEEIWKVSSLSVSLTGYSPSTGGYGNELTCQLT